MDLKDILTPERTHSGVFVHSKKKSIQRAAEFISSDQNQLEQDLLFAGLIGREKLGSTGVGEGVAIPHCRMPGCENITGALIHLAEPVDFDAIDENPVDLIFALVVPDIAHDEHIKVLAGLAERFNNHEYRSKLRQAADSDDLYRAAIS